MAKTEYKIKIDIENLDKIKVYVEELYYLRHFYEEADFGPAHEEVVDLINSSYEGDIPQGYNL